MTTEYHAEHVGSLLRPPWLLEARESYAKGTLSKEALREAEDRVIAEHLAMQQEAGLRVFTDGEARRDSWRAGLIEALDGLVPAARPMKWYRDGKEVPPEEIGADGVRPVHVSPNGRAWVVLEKHVVLAAEKSRRTGIVHPVSPGE